MLLLCFPFSSLCLLNVYGSVPLVKSSPLAKNSSVKKKYFVVLSHRLILINGIVILYISVSLAYFSSMLLKSIKIPSSP